MSIFAQWNSALYSYPDMWLYGLSELNPQLTAEFQLWYDRNGWLAPKLLYSVLPQMRFS